MGVLKMYFHVTVFVSVPWDNNTAAHKAQIYSLDESVLIERAL